MDITKFDLFDQKCSERLPNEIDKILEAANGNRFCAIGFITTDDFFGCYLSWDYSNNIDEYYDWENGRNGDFYELCKKEGIEYQGIPAFYYSK